jgi:glutamate synthase (NADPH/NADH) small chain
VDETAGGAKMDKKRIIPHKTPMPEQDPRERARNFREVPYGYTAEMAMAEARRCLQCKKRPCVAGCPVGIDIPAFIERIGEGDFRGAIRKMKEKNALPAICGRVCPQEDQCELVCILAKKHEPVAIGRLERFIADWEAEQGDMEVPPRPRPTGKSVAVVGAGPAGLTVAGDLVMMGHEVTVYEALHKSGGVLVYGIPEFRLPKAILAREANYLSRLGVDFKVSHVVGKIVSVDELLERHQAVFIGTGAGLPYFMNIEGENALGVYSANEWLTRINLMKGYAFPQADTPVKRGRALAVVGGGNTAMDSARCGLRLGYEKVYLVYRRSSAEMPARKEEIHHAEEEGIDFHLLQNPVGILTNSKGWVEGIRCIRMELGEPDASGRRRPVPMAGSEFELEVDAVVMAVGQGANPLVPSTTPGLDVNKWGNIIADPKSFATSKKGVFAGGDIVTGGATVILAMGAGRTAAQGIDEYLR